MAKKETILTYLDQHFTKEFSDYDIALDWDVKNHTIEVIFRLFAENKQGVTIDDVEGTISEEEIIEFEDGILFYDQKKSVITEEDYLAVISFEGKKGIQKSVLDGFINYLKDVLADGQNDLIDFLMDDKAEVFEIRWSKTDFLEAIIKAEKEPDEYIAYPSY